MAQGGGGVEGGQEGGGAVSKVSFQRENSWRILTWRRMGGERRRAKTKKSFTTATLLIINCWFRLFLIRQLWFHLRSPWTASITTHAQPLCQGCWLFFESVLQSSHQCTHTYPRSSSDLCSAALTQTGRPSSTLLNPWVQSHWAFLNVSSFSASSQGRYINCVF